MKQAVGTLQQRHARPRIPYLVLMDEASAYMNVEGIERLFEQARSAGVGLVAAALAWTAAAAGVPAQTVDWPTMFHGFQIRAPILPAAPTTIVLTSSLSPIIRRPPPTSRLRR